MVGVLHEDLGTISNLLMLTNPQTTFAMFSLCYAQCLSYLFHTMFPSLGILKHYAKFDTHTIVTLKKIFNTKSFGGSISHLAHHQAILPISSNKFGSLL